MTEPGSDQRHSLHMTLLVAVAIAISYIDRANLSHAASQIAHDLGMGPVEQGWAFSAFSVGYVVFMIPAGLLVDRFGASRVACVAVSSWSIVTIATAWSSGSNSLIACRVLLGAAEAPIFPAAAAIVRLGVATDSRGRATALFDGGSHVGTAIAAPLCVYTILWFGWQASFLACGLLGFCWVGLWARANSRSQSKVASPTAHSLAPVRLFFNRQVAGAGIGFLCYNYVKSFFLTWFPTYLVIDRHFAFSTVGLLGMLPALAALIGEATGGYFTDYLTARGVGPTHSRKWPLCLGLIGASAVAFVPLCGPDWLAVGLLCAAFGALISASPAIWALPGDIAPHPMLVGSLGGAQNAIANVGGIVSPIVTGFFFARSGSFGPALATTAVVSLIGAASFGFILDTVAPLRLEREEPVAHPNL